MEGSRFQCHDRVAVLAPNWRNGSRLKQTVADELVPTPIVDHKARPQIALAASYRATRFPLLRMAFKFLSHAANNVRLRVLRRYDADDAALRLRQVFEQLGGLWIKVGQLIAMRNDLFSDAVCRELSQLQSRALGFPFELVRKAIRQDLGLEIEDIFESFDPHPFAAASISQVHFARLGDNYGKVCVKVLRPDAESAFLRDLAAIRRLIRVMHLFGIGRHLQLGEALYQLEAMVKEELDFRFEASNTRRMRKSLRDHDILVPRVHRKYCGQHVLVTEFIDGVLMTDFIETGRRDPARQAHWCAANEVDPEKVARRLFYSCMRQLLEDNQFHADVHPGNILLLRENKVALIDFGTIGRTEKAFLANYQRSLAALAERDFAKAVDVTMQLTLAPPALDDIKPLRKELIRCYKEWDARTHLSGVGYHERSMAAAGSASGKVMANYGVLLSWDIMRISRTWGTLDASISHLYPDANYMKLFQGYFRRAERRSRSLKALVPRFVRTAATINRSVQEYESLLGPDLRRRIVYSSAAVQMSQRFALSLISLLKLFKWIIYFALAGTAAALIDKHYVDLIWLEEHLVEDFFDLVHRFGAFDLALGAAFLIVLVYYLSQAIGKLNPKN